MRAPFWRREQQTLTDAEVAAVRRRARGQPPEPLDIKEEQLAPPQSLTPPHREQEEAAAESGELRTRPVRASRRDRNQSRAAGSRRAETKIPAAVVSLSGTELSRPLPGVIEVISAGGISLCTEAPLEPGARLQVLFVLPGDGQPTQAEAEIVACERFDDEVSVAHCQFVDLPRSTLGHLMNWIARRA